MSDHWSRKPKIVGAHAARLRLTREERFLVARIDGQLSLADLGNVTGLGAERVGDLVAKLQGEGAVHLAEAPIPVESPRLIRRAPPPPKDDYVPPQPQPQPQPLEPEPERELAPMADEELPEAIPALADAFEEAMPETAPDAAPAEQVEEPKEAPVTEKEDEASRAVAERNYRQVYEVRWHPLPIDTRAAKAKEVRGADLFALCFDPDHHVIAGVLENSTVGFEHVRLIAFYHRTGTGLELLTRRNDWLRDTLVERRLLRNPMAGDLVLNRLMSAKMLLPTYKTAIDRDIPETTRVKVRGMLRKKWQTAPPDQRAELLLRTEARCLILMTGCTFDAKTTGILCGRPINSVMFVQSVAKFGAAPPGLLAHLIKQPFVRKNMPLKKMLLAHPNMPGDVKRSI